MDKKYWENYYKVQHATSQASLFAQFVFKDYVKNGETLIEFGCGNGRDSVFFSHHGINVTAVDQCENEIELLAKQNQLSNLQYIASDFTKLSDNMGSFNNIYSRFTLHSVSEKDENAVIKWSYEHLQKNGKILIEARGQKNELYRLGDQVPGEPTAYIYENHYRRFIDIHVLTKKLIDIGFEIVLSEEKNGFAPFGDTDYIFMRLIALKK